MSDQTLNFFSRPPAPSKLGCCPSLLCVGLFLCIPPFANTQSMLQYPYNNYSPEIYGGGNPSVPYSVYSKTGQLPTESAQQPFGRLEQPYAGAIHFPEQHTAVQHAQEPPRRDAKKPVALKTGPTNPGAMQFAWRLFTNTILPQEGNGAICPILPQLLLASLYDAADNGAKAELLSSLMASKDELKPLIDNQLAAANRSVANKLDYATVYLLGKDVQLNKDFVGKAIRDGVSFNQVNFMDRNAAAATANRWVAEKTYGAIREIISPATLDANTRLLMASVIYFKGKWKHQFTKTETMFFESAPNYENTRGPTVGKPLPMMYQYNRFRYGEKALPDGNGIRWIELPYEGSGGLSMLLMLPKIRHQLQRTAEQLTATDVGEIISSLNQPGGTYKTHLSVPKFNLFSSMTLAPALKNMGLKAIFDRSSALSGLSNEQLVVRDVTQRTFISIDEQGTTATSAAALSFVALSAAPPPPIINFTVNEPFLLMIVDKTYEYPMFVGKIVSPETI